MVAWRWSDCRKIPHVQGQRSPRKTVGAGVAAPSVGAAVVQEQRRSLRKMVGGVKLCFESNPIPSRDAQRAQTNLSAPGHRNPQRLRQNCVWLSPEEVCVSSGLSQGQELWVQNTWVWHKPSWRRSPLTPQQSHQNLHRTGETDSWRAQAESVCTRT